MPLVQEENPFVPVNTSSLVGSMSPSQLSLALNTFSYFFVSPKTGSTSLGVIKVPVPKNKCRVIIRLYTKFNFDESIALSVRYSKKEGNWGQLGETMTLDDSLSKGEHVFDMDIGGLPVGTPLHLVRLYTEGMEPEEPEFSVVVRFF